MAFSENLRRRPRSSFHLQTRTQSQVKIKENEKGSFSSWIQYAQLKVGLPLKTGRMKGGMPLQQFLTWNEMEFIWLFLIPSFSMLMALVQQLKTKVLLSEDLNQMLKPLHTSSMILPPLQDSLHPIMLFFLCSSTGHSQVYFYLQASLLPMKCKLHGRRVFACIAHRYILRTQDTAYQGSCIIAC